VYLNWKNKSFLFMSEIFRKYEYMYQKMEVYENIGQ